MTTIDGSEFSGVTIDGEEVQEITIDGSTAWANIVNELMAFGDRDGNIYVYNYKTDNTVHTFNRGDVENMSLAAELGHNRIAIWDESMNENEWDIYETNNFNKITTENLNIDGSNRNIAINDTYIGVSNTNDEIALYDHDGNLQTSFSADGSGYFDIAPDSSFVAHDVSAGVKTYDLNGNSLATMDEGNESPRNVSCLNSEVAYSTGYDEHNIYIHDYNDSSNKTKITDCSDNVRVVQLTPNYLFASHAGSNEFYFYDRNSGSGKFVATSKDDECGDLTVSGDEEYLMLEDDGVSVWEISSETYVKHWDDSVVNYGNPETITSNSKFGF